MKSGSKKTTSAAAPKGSAATSVRKRLRRSSEGGYARGDETRRRIIDVAMQLFGERGFDGASTREIAAVAGVNAPALQYYFDNKEGVYLACVEHIIDDMRAVFDPVMQRADAALRTKVPVGELIDSFIAIYGVIIDCAFAQPQAARRRLFLTREFNTEEPTVARILLEKKLRRPFAKISLELLSRISGVPANSPVTRIRMMSLKGQILPLYHAPGLALEALGWTKLDATKIALVKATLLDQVRGLLGIWAQEGLGSSEIGASLGIVE
ncbi:CerR family C-terminal domain-containing protein [Rudaea sp. 3F27F6]|uniref:CerR family C-terminal domain-containing protein n=1 Tax=Rudaea sp. 3F27F6 TaxID=2502208 RepID=UPI0010F62FAE|nr:CerR family C-terminal domain-containing protein [Rudaea sp. 3F27F6]